MNNNLIFEKNKNGVATLTLNVPNKLNAMNQEMLLEFPKIIREVHFDESIKVLILTGAGRGFCSGSDVRRQAARIAGAEIEKTRWEVIEPLGSFLMPLAKLEKPTIAAVNGITAGLGLSLALICDIRIVSEKASFSALWIKSGLIGDCGATYYLPKIVGMAKAIELLYSGDSIDAVEAQRIGLANKVVSHERLMQEATERAEELANGPSIALGLMKKALYSHIIKDLEAHLYFETHAINVCRQTEYHKEFVKSFIEKRKM